MIYICIPTYNEERTVGVLLWKIRQVMAEFQRDYQILVVDDASADATAEILQPYTRVLPLTVHRNEQRQGYAGALETLIREAIRRSRYPKRDVIVTLQADFTEEPEEIPTLVKRIEGGADVVTSVMRLTREDAPRTVRWTRKALGLVLRRAEWPEPVTDPLSGFRAYRVITLRKLLQQRDGRRLLEWDGWTANAGLLRAVLPFARRVDEAPVPIRYHRRRRETRFRPWEAGRQILQFLRAGPDTPVTGNGHAAPGTGTARRRHEPQPGDGPGRGADPASERPRPRRRGSARSRSAGGVGANGAGESAANGGQAEGGAEARGAGSGGRARKSGRRRASGGGGGGGEGAAETVASAASSSSGRRSRGSGRQGGRGGSRRTAAPPKGNGQGDRSGDSPAEGS